jgi:hypothetical protein
MSENIYIISDNELDMTRTITRAIRKKIHAKQRGWVFSPKEFANLGSRAAIDQALSRLQRSGSIRRLARGLYEFPRIHPQIGILSPSPEAVAKAVAAKTHSRLSVSEAKAANLLGLSTQVPAQNVFLTDGPSRTVQVGKQAIVLKHAAPSRMVGAGSEAGIVIQAVRSFGPKAAEEIPVESLSKRLPAKVKSDLKRLASAAPAWSQPVLKKIAA